jgi:hypothetical protein
MRRSFLLCVPGPRRFFAVPQWCLWEMNKSRTIIVAAILWAIAVPFARASGTVQPQVLHGHVRKITKKLSPLGRLDANYQMHVAIGLPLRNPEQLTNLLEGIYNPSSPNFRHFLKPDEFAAAFGPSAQDCQSVIDFAKAHHLNVTHTHPNRTLIDLTGSVADIESAFHLHMHMFKHPKENRNFFAPDADPSLDLKTPVLAISGLDNYVKPHPHRHPAFASSRPLVRPFGGNGGGGGGGGGGGSNTGPFEGYDFRDAYIPSVSLEGAGQSVGLFELFTFGKKDITAYEEESGIHSSVTVTPIYIDGAVMDDTSVDYLSYPGYLDYAIEVTSDIEMAISMAPGLSNVLVYEGPTPMDQPPMATNYVQTATTTAQINDVLNRMATDNLAKQLSCSYGFDINLSTVQIFQQYAAQGQSFFQASGDNGAYTTAVDEPADDPYITVVGGTSLTTDTNGAWSSEVVWLTPAGFDEFGNPTPQVSSGGGVSLAYAIPSWQQGISMTANQGSTIMRNLPDVAMVANNVNIVWGYDYGLDQVDMVDWQLAGTSLAAPLWAGFTALVNQQTAANGQPPVGFLNPALYALAKSTNYNSCFHDITSGKNTSAASPTKYSATAGYDLCTGWGTISDGLFNALLAPPSEPLRITSSLGFTSQGPTGGPFSVTTQTYTLTNTGSSPLTWSLVNTSSWLNVSASAGSLNPGASTAVTVSLNANANGLLITHASGNLTFNNLTGGTAQNRQFDLYVGNGGFETGGLNYWTLVGDSNFDFAIAGDDADVAGAEELDGQPDALFVHSGIYGAYLGNWPSIGTLSQTVPTIPGQRLLVSFWLNTVPDQNGNYTPNAFAAKWNGSTLFSGTDLTNSAWTNLQYIVSPLGTSGTLQFSFNDSPGAFGLDDITVQTLPPPILTSTSVEGGNIDFNWNAFLNVSYQIQSSTNLAALNWANVGGTIVATNTVMHASLPMANAPNQFYRVAMLPP